jgi:hypothetical protein
LPPWASLLQPCSHASLNESPPSNKFGGVQLPTTQRSFATHKTASANSNRTRADTVSGGTLQFSTYYRFRNNRFNCARLFSSVTGKEYSLTRSMAADSIKHFKDQMIMFYNYLPSSLYTSVKFCNRQDRRRVCSVPQ